MRKYLTLSHLLLLGLLLCQPALAKIYTWTDADGNTIYSDQAHEGATEVKLPPPQVWAHEEIRTTISPRIYKKNTPASIYRVLSITQPLHDQSLRSDNGQISIVLAIKPALLTKQGHHIRITLDDKVVIEKTNKTRLILTTIDRGSHQLIATILDASGKTLIQSKPVTFHLQRTSIQHKATQHNKANTPPP